MPIASDQTVEDFYLGLTHEFNVSVTKLIGDTIVVTAAVIFIAIVFMSNPLSVPTFVLGMASLILALMLIGTILVGAIYRPILTISPDGVRDRRVSQTQIPWQSVKNVRQWIRIGPYGIRTKWVLVEIHEEEDARIKENWWWFNSRRKANKTFKLSGIQISDYFLRPSHEELLDLTSKYWRRYGVGRCKACRS